MTVAQQVGYTLQFLLISALVVTVIIGGGILAQIYFRGEWRDR